MGRRSNQGFNLVETMAAVVVLVLALFAVISVHTYTLRAASGNKNHQIALSIASTQLAYVESILKVDFNVPESSLSTNVLQASQFPEFSFRVTDQGYEDPGRDLRSVVVEVFWKEKGVDKSYDLSTTFFNF